MKKETHPFKIILRFEDEEDREQWLAWWLDGGGDQSANFDTEWGRKEAKEYYESRVLRLSAHATD